MAPEKPSPSLIAAMAAEGDSILPRGTPCWSITASRTVRRPSSLIRAATSSAAAVRSAEASPCRRTKPGCPTPEKSEKSALTKSIVDGLLRRGPEIAENRAGTTARSAHQISVCPVAPCRTRSRQVRREPELGEDRLGVEEERQPLEPPAGRLVHEQRPGRIPAGRVRLVLCPRLDAVELARRDQYRAAAQARPRLLHPPHDVGRAGDPHAERRHRHHRVVVQQRDQLL